MSLSWLSGLDFDNLPSWLSLAVGAGVVCVFGLLLLKKHFRGSFYTGSTMMEGNTVIITGANCGIGFATAMELAKRKARVILACRDIKKGEAAATDIRRVAPMSDVCVMKLDLASLASVRAFAKQIIDEEGKVDVLINNAGVVNNPVGVTEDGFEWQMGVNHLGHFLLTNLLLEKLKSSAQCRVVVVSSRASAAAKLDLDNFSMAQDSKKVFRPYSNSKLANDLFSRELARRTDKDGICVYCVHPGMVQTEVARHVGPAIVWAILFFFLKPVVKTPFEGAQTTLYCALEETLAGKTGRYYADCSEAPWPPNSVDDEKAKKLWDLSEELTGLVSK